MVAADGDQQVLVLDLGVVPRHAAGQGEARAQIDVAVDLQTVALTLVGVDQAVGVVDAADSRELHVLDVIQIGRGVQAGAAVPQASLEAGLIRHDRFRIRRGQNRQVAALDRRTAIAAGHAGEQVQAVVDLIQGAHVPADLLVADRDLTFRIGRRADHDATMIVAAVVGIAQAAGQFQGVCDLIVGLTEDRPGVRLLHDVGDLGRHETADAVEGARHQIDALVPVEGADLPAQTARPVRGQAQFIGVLQQIAGQGAGLDRERSLVACARRRARGDAAVDIAVALGPALEGADHAGQGRRAEIIGHLQRLGGGLLLLEVVAAAVIPDRLAIEVVVQLVRALGQDVGAVHRARALIVARLQGQHGRETVSRGPGDVDAARHIVEIAQVLAVLLGEGGVIGVVDPVVAVVPQGRHAHRQRIRRRQGHGRLGAGRAIVAVGDRAEAGELIARLGGVDLDHAGRGVAAEQGALRPAQHFQLLHVEQGEAFQIDAFQNQLVHHHRHRLRRREVEVHIAQAADVEARGVAAVGAFDLQAGHPAR